MSALTLGRFLLDGPYVVGCRHDLNDARLAASLRAAGLDVRLYAGKSEGRVVDLARQFARMRTAACCWAVTPLSLAVSAQVARQLALVNPDALLLFRGAVSDADWQALGCPDLPQAHRVPDEPAALAQALVGLGLVPALQAPVDPHASPYLSGLLGEDDLARIGLDAAQDPAVLAEELAWLAGLAELPDTLPLHATGADAATRQRTAELLARAVDAAPALAGRLRWVDGADGTPPAAPASDASAPSAPSVPSAPSALSTPAAPSYGVHGVTALHTGLYAERQPSPGMRHLVLSAGLDAAQRRAACAWAAPHLETRCAAVLMAPLAQEPQQEPQQQREQQHERQHEPAANRATDALDAWLQPLATPHTGATGGWPMHTYAHAAGEAPGWQAVHFDGRRLGTLATRRLSFQAWASAAGEGLAQAPGPHPTPTPAPTAAPSAPSAPLGGHAAPPLTVLSLDTEADLAAFEAGARALQCEGRLQLPAPAGDAVVEHSCRWLPRGACALGQLKRVTVQPDLRLTSCGDTHVLGQVGEPFDALVAGVRRRQQQQAVARDCATCAVRDSCSQCSHLPQAWGGRYCGLRQALPVLPLYVELLSMGRALAPLFGLPAGQALALQVWQPGLPGLLGPGSPAEAAGTHAAPARPGQAPVLLSAAGRHLVWWRGTRRLCRLSPALALMAEAWWRAHPAEHTVQALVQRFAVAPDTARASLAQGLAKLRAEGVVGEAGGEVGEGGSSADPNGPAPSTNAAAPHTGEVAHA